VAVVRYTLITRALLGSLALAVVSLAAGYTVSGHIAPAAVALAVGSGGLAAERRQWRWAAAVGLLALVGAAAIGIALDLQPALMLIGVVAALSAWDLSAFMGRLAAADNPGDQGAPEQTLPLQRQHLRRLLLVNALGLAAAGTALAVQINFRFELAVLLAAAAITGLTAALSSVRASNE
jgi:hypothetical protein